MTKKQQKAYRADRVSLGFPWETSEGYLKARPVVSRTGVFTYVNADGSLRKELRHPDDVFLRESLDSLRGIPVTLGHPTELVNADNSSAYQKGYTGDESGVDGRFLKVNMTISHADAVEAVKSGQNQLSLGYEVLLIEEAGEYNGERYDYRQTGIVYNHLAIVDKARAGEEANIKMDGVDPRMTSQEIIDQPAGEGNKATNNDSDSNEKKEKRMKKINLDGVGTVEVEDNVAAHIDSLEAARDKAETKADRLEGELSTANGRADALEKECNDLKSKNSDEAIHKAVADRLDLENKARVILGDKAAKFDGMTNDQIIDKANKHYNGDKDIEGDANYKKAYFDIAHQGRSDRDDADSRREINSPSAPASKGRKFDSEDEDRNWLMKQNADSFDDDDEDEDK